ncbi:MAG: hypothetical protein JWM98_564, partial [Thermoleophilia bacterium]|nr:hypothetical protein [Thermoleophilia bacterium]
MSDALRRFQAHPEMSRAEERAAVEARTFATLDAPQRTAARFPDPQAPPSSGEATLVAPGLARASVLVEPMVYETMERVRRPITAAAATPPPPDPAEIARQVVAEARATARTMLAQARDVIASERAQAVQAGYDEGYAKGVADADTEMSGLVATCEQIGVQVMAERERALADYEPDVVELA